MQNKVFVYDPTAHDPLSKVRGIGRYLQILKENFAKEFTFIDNLDNLPGDSTLINPFFNFLKPPLTLKKISRKKIAVIHDVIPLTYPTHFPVGLRGKLNIFLNKLALKRYDLIVTDSEHSKKTITETLSIPSEQIEVIYPILSHTFTHLVKEKYDFSQLAKFNVPLSYCIYVGDATWNKNLVNLAKAIKLANISCVFVGKIFGQRNLNSLTHPWQKELKEFIEETADDKRFIFPGYITDEELVTLYQHAKANILISHDEGFGFSYFEAAAVGTPSVLSDAPIFHETAADTALFTSADKPEEIANKILEMISNTKLRNELADKAKKRVDHFSPTIFREKWLKIAAK